MNNFQKKIVRLALGNFDKLTDFEERFIRRLKTHINDCDYELSKDQNHVLNEICTERLQG